MKSKKTKKLISVIAIILAVCLLTFTVIIPAVKLLPLIIAFAPFVVYPLLPSRLFSYDTVKLYLLYDHIHYNGACYYQIDPDDIPAEIKKGERISKDVFVVLVDRFCNPYDEERMEPAMRSTDAEVGYLWFDSGEFKLRQK